MLLCHLRRALQVLRNRRGVFAAEYAVLAVGVVVVVGSAVVGFRSTFNSAFTGAGTAIGSTQSSLASSR